MEIIISAPEKQENKLTYLYSSSIISSKFRSVLVLEPIFVQTPSLLHSARSGEVQRALGGEQHMVLDLDLRSSVVLSSVHEPLYHADNEHNCECNDAVVHAASRDRQLGREDEEDGGYNDVRYSEQICEPGEGLRELEVSRFGQHAAAAQAVDGDWDGVAEAERHDRGGCDGVEGAGAAEEDAAEDYDDEGG